MTTEGGHTVAGDETGGRVTDERPEAAQSCCGPAPKAGGSCCGSAAEAVPAEKQSSCCGAPARQEEPAGRQASCCGAPPAPPVDYPYGPAAYVTGAIDTPAGPVLRVSRDITGADRLGAWRVRWGFGRGDYRVKPGLYAVGTPAATSTVLVTGNYKLTLDHLRSALDDLDAWLLVARHTRDQRLVRGRQGHVLRRGDRAHGPRDAARRGRRAPPARAPAAVCAWRRRPRGQEGLRLSRDLRTGARHRPAGVPCRRDEGRCRRCAW